MCGQGTVEYGLLIATVAVLVLIGVAAFGGVVETWFRALVAHVTTMGS